MNQKLFVLIENCFQSSLCAFAKPEPVISRLRDQFRDSLIFQDLPLFTTAFLFRQRKLYLVTQTVVPVSVLSVTTKQRERVIIEMGSIEIA